MRRDRHTIAALLAVLAGLFVAVPTFAQTPTPPSPPPPASRFWMTAGGGSTTLKGDCSTCTVEPRYDHTGHILINFGMRGNSRLDGGVEFVWAPAETVDGESVRTTMLLGVAQFRPWQERGLFLKAGMGIAFVKNFVYDATNDVFPPYTTNAMALTYGAGWEFRGRGRAGFQIYGTHHIVALGDLAFNEGTVENVLGNYWSLGASIVIR